MASKSWLHVPADSHFSIANIPFGIISTKESPEHRPAIAIGEQVLDLQAFAANNGFDKLPSIHAHLDVFSQPTLNAFASLGRPVHREVRQYLQSILSSDTPAPEVLQTNTALQAQALLPQTAVTMHLPLHIGDYTDFYAGLNHAFTVGTMFRGAANALQPNYKHIPVGYHGRASSIVVSGTPITRPQGQIILDPAAHPDVPTFSACRRLDIELELGAFVSRPNPLGQRVPISRAEDCLFGVVLLNDWSARDIQQWEYVPLGPFNGKNFGSTISPWVVLMDALEPFRAVGLESERAVLPYLKEGRKDTVYDIKLEVDLTTPSGTTTTITRTTSSNLLWSFPQMLTHHSAGGCNLQTGDLLGSGTISGTADGTQGSLLEQNHAGKKDILLGGMEVRKFLKDGDTVTIRGLCGEGSGGGLVGFGECVGRIEAAAVLEEGEGSGSS